MRNLRSRSLFSIKFLFKLKTLYRVWKIFWYITHIEVIELICTECVHLRGIAVQLKGVECDRSAKIKFIFIVSTLRLFGGSRCVSYSRIADGDSPIQQFFTLCVHYNSLNWYEIQFERHNKTVLTVRLPVLKLLISELFRTAKHNNAAYDVFYYLMIP